MAASSTRNPAIPRLMAYAFHTVLPDMQAPDPLRHLVRPDVFEVAEDYAVHIGADPAEVPFVLGRYIGGLYGGPDPGLGMRNLLEISTNPENGIIMIATDRREA